MVLSMVAGALVAAAAQSPSYPGDAASRLFDSEQLLRDLRTLAADDMAGRAMGTVGGARARALLLARFEAAGLQPVGPSYEHPFQDPRGASEDPAQSGGVNLVGLLPGTRTPARYIVLSAHYDHIGIRDGEVFNGANDNASGAAALAVIAEYFVRQPLQSSIIVAAFDGEERGLLGSRAFMRAPPVPRDTLLVNVNADMIGRDQSETLYVAGTSRFPFLRPFVSRVASTAPVRLLMGHDGAPANRGEDWTRDSDHYAFIEAGIPAVYVGVEDYRYLHRANDEFATIMPVFYVRAVETLIALLREFDAGADVIAEARR